MFIFYRHLESKMDQNVYLIQNSFPRRTLFARGGGSSIVKVLGDVPPSRVCFFKPSSLARGILFANFSPFGLAKGILFANFRPFSLGKGILFGNFGQRNVKLR